MKVIINKEEYEYLDHIIEDEKIRNNFMELIKDTFGVDFRQWYKEGYWSDKYEPHVLVKDGQVVATVTVNHMKYLHEGEKTYIQLGGVVTRKEYRKRDLGKWLIEHIIKRYKEQCDQIFLLCNDSAVEFYPKCGFVKAVEHIAQYEWDKESKEVHKSKVRKLNMDDKDDRKLLVERYKMSNPFSKFPSTECEELLLFYCIGWRKDCIYYFPEQDLVAIAKFRKIGLILEDIYGRVAPDKNQDMGDLVRMMLGGILTLNGREEEKMTVFFGFTPKKELSNLTIKPLLERDDTMYLLPEKENLFEQDKLRFPILSHN